MIRRLRLLALPLVAAVVMTLSLASPAEALRLGYTTYHSCNFLGGSGDDVQQTTLHRCFARTLSNGTYQRGPWCVERTFRNGRLIRYSVWRCSAAP